MKIKIHALKQDDIEADTVLAVHARTTDGNRSTRVFGLYRYPRTGIMLAEFGGRFVREFVEHELGYWRTRMTGYAAR